VSALTVGAVAFFPYDGAVFVGSCLGAAAGIGVDVSDGMDCIGADVPLGNVSAAQVDMLGAAAVGVLALQQQALLVVQVVGAVAAFVRLDALARTVVVVLGF